MLENRRVRIGLIVGAIILGIILCLIVPLGVGGYFAKVNLDRLDADIQTTKTQVQSFENDLAAINQQVSNLQGNLDALQINYNSLETDYNALTGNYNSLKSEFDSLKTATDAVKNELAGVQEQGKTLEADLQQAKDGQADADRRRTVSALITELLIYSFRPNWEELSGVSNPREYTWSEAQTVVNKIDDTALTDRFNTLRNNPGSQSNWQNYFEYLMNQLIELLK